MIGSYVTIGLKQLVGQKLYAAINIIGLTLGIACSLLIALFVRHELSYDKHYAKSDRIYRTSKDLVPAGRAPMHLAANAGAAAPLLKQDFPQIEKIGRLAVCGGGFVVKRAEATFFETGFATADNELFEIFDFEWVYARMRRADAARGCGAWIRLPVAGSRAHDQRTGDRD
jgi:putative ABC transport system permease protein